MLNFTRLKEWCAFGSSGRRLSKEPTDVARYVVETIEAMQKHLLGYRDNLRVEVDPGISIVARTVAELRTIAHRPRPTVQRDDGKAIVLIEPRLCAAAAYRWKTVLSLRFSHAH